MRHHDHDHAHGHGHDHGSHAPTDFGRAFLIGTLLNVAFVIVEASYGFLANSVALLADAGHNLSDVLGLLIAWGASVLARQEASERYSFGLKKASIIAALINALLLLLAVGAILAEAIRRLFEPELSSGGTVMGVAAVGIVINAVTAMLFARGRHHEAVSAAVVVAGLMIKLTGQPWIDPAASIGVALVILWSTWGLLRESIIMTLAGVPSGIDPARIRELLAAIPGVLEVDHLHIWALSTTETALTVHLLVGEGCDRDAVLAAARQQLRTTKVGHSTIEVTRTGQQVPAC
jgi:cobalt-zinc-cadmium efflux system protein